MQALDLAELSRLEADLVLKPAGAGWRLKGRIQANLVQTCGVTLDPLPSTVDSTFSVDLVAADAARSEDQTFDLDPDGPDGPDVVEDGAVNLAAYVAEHLALAIDPWPRKPGAVFEAPSGPAEPSPFDVLRQLKSDE
ncbi:MAG: DUF177 domain-containing protein [Caulobacterales bacterium]|nr:DUF177 domain-containing protein [Caulobacterales bacterium]